MMNSERNLSSLVDGQSKSSDEPREEMIETAVSFLHNPRVMQSEASHKTYFLKKKGLTTEEINTAMKRAISTFQKTNNELMQLPSSGPVSFWPKLHAFSSTTVVIGTSLYLLYRLYKKYIVPYFFGIPQEQDRITALEKAMKSLDNSIRGLDYLFSSLNQKLDSCCATMQAMQSSETSKNLSLDFDSVKRDISSLKGLLLNRKQFPPAPVISPVIPSWQREQPSISDKVDSAAGHSYQQPTFVDNNSDSRLEVVSTDSERPDVVSNKNSDSNSSDNGSYVCVGEVEGN